MTTYDDPIVNALEKRITLVTDETVPTLSAVIEVDLVSGETVVHRQSMRETDYQFTRQELLAMLGRIAAEQGLDPNLLARIDRFCTDLPKGSITDVTAVFAQACRV